MRKSRKTSRKAGYFRGKGRNRKWVGRKPTKRNRHYKQYGAWAERQKAAVMRLRKLESKKREQEKKNALQQRLKRQQQRKKVTVVVEPKKERVTKKVKETPKRKKQVVFTESESEVWANIDNKRIEKEIKKTEEIAKNKPKLKDTFPLGTKARVETTVEKAKENPREIYRELLKQMLSSTDDELRENIIDTMSKEEEIQKLKKNLFYYLKVEGENKDGEEGSADFVFKWFTLAELLQKIGGKYEVGCEVQSNQIPGDRPIVGYDTFTKLNDRSYFISKTELIIVYKTGA